MKSGIEPLMPHSSKEGFIFAFQWWLFIFVSFLVPLDFIYRLGSLLSGLSLWQIVANFSTMVVFFTIAALTLAFLSWLVARLWSTLSLHGPELVNKGNAMIGLAIVGITFFDYFFRWAKKVFSIPNLFTNHQIRYIIIFLLLAIIVAAIIIFFNKLKFFYERINSISQSSFKFNLTVVAICIVTSSIFISNNLFLTQSEGKQVSVIDKNKLNSYPNIIIITFDSLSAQHTSLHGYHYNTTRNLDKLGQVSYIFDNMYASCNWTFPSLSSLMTGKNLTRHHITDQFSFFSGEQRYQNLPAALKRLGYETAVVGSNKFSSPWVSDLKGYDNVSPEDSREKFLCHIGLGPNQWLERLIGETRIFRVIHDFSFTWVNTKNVQVSDRANIEKSFLRASKILDGLRPPFFLWIHVLPPHAPYLPVGKYKYSILKEKIYDEAKDFDVPPFSSPYSPEDQPKVDKFSMRYDELISYADSVFGEFLSRLKERGLFDRSILIVSSDHGEMFEKGFWSHGGPYLSQSLIHIPMVMHLPGQIHPQRIDANVSHVDIAPTLLDLLGAKPPAWMDGKSFLPALQDSNFDTGTKFSMQLSYVLAPPSHRTKTIAAIKGNYKLINYLDWKRYELYDVKNDPKEQIDLTASKPEIFSALKAEIDLILRR
jgi:arylsulfatase A-like enzyme